jgi:hypothetical protein
MARNIFSRSYSTKLAGTGVITSAPVVFISHSSKDKGTARLLAEFLVAGGIDIYFDEYDQDLADATQVGDSLKIAACIEKGLSSSTHLLGLLTANTLHSVWVPYEIGGARGRGRPCAHIVDRSVLAVPEYVLLGQKLDDIADLRKWISSTAQVSLTDPAISWTTKSAQEKLAFSIPEYRGSVSVIR